MTRVSHVSIYLYLSIFVYFRNATEELKDIPVTINDFDKLVEACIKEESPLLEDVKHEIRDGKDSSISRSRVHTHQGNVGETYFFFQGQRIVREFMICQGNMKYCQNIRALSRNFTFQSCKSLDVWSWCTFHA